MNKKKIIALLIVGGLTIGAVGGSFAWFTSSDSVMNKFSTVGVKDPLDLNEDAGVKVDEIFTEAFNVLPGEAVNKDVRVESTAGYNQYVRVKFEKSFNTEELNTDDNLKLIELNFKEDAFTTGNWFDGGDGYYYYKIIVEAENEVENEDNKEDVDVTKYLLDSVTLSSKAGNDMKNVRFTVNAIAEGIQATKEAVEEVWGVTVDGNGQLAPK
ncbi:SipW-dependent biofilm matrix protein BsaA [Clostridium paraputrificum]|uniref:SipW-dependent biofilm matrix protein BsaA n=1 Tax=Clostridium TaxID=1485 RepID=UPI003D34ED9A